MNKDVEYNNGVDYGIQRCLLLSPAIAGMRERSRGPIACNHFGLKLRHLLVTTTFNHKLPRRTAYNEIINLWKRAFHVLTTLTCSDSAPF